MNHTEPGELWVQRENPVTTESERLRAEAGVLK